MAMGGITKVHLAQEKKRTAERNAGILLHITSLPSNFGIGDLGPEAWRFVEFLHRSGQRYWQLLPVNPVSEAQQYSPYSSTSSMAGNPLLISPELLKSDGMLTASELRKHTVPSRTIADYREAKQIRNVLLRKAADNFFKRSVSAFAKFCQREAHWLNDFSLFTVLKHHHGDTPWFSWESELITRSPNALKKFSNEFRDELQYVMWQQYIFFTQWHQLRTYAHSCGVQFFGDLPFYVSYDSADVWANREIFNVDKLGAMKGVAGVPPDYFNRNGQLWGMPTFKWDILKSGEYDWWVRRIQQNMKMFDLLRLDHFRAFADYWEVPASHSTAKKGKWRPGPGRHFFEVLQSKLKILSLVAEDLGDINDAVIELRTDLKIPGMKILQFAFGNNMPASDYIPHNYERNFIVYTGTHDNNTTVGWFLNDISANTRKQIAAYISKPVDEINIHSELSRLAYASIAKTAIIPLQDVLGLDGKARMNTPASTANNWLWRFRKGSLTNSLERKLLAMVRLYNR
jgi:4-alpha-glucanotransferase